MGTRTGVVSGGMSNAAAAAAAAGWRGRKTEYRRDREEREQHRGGDDHDRANAREPEKFHVEVQHIEAPRAATGVKLRVRVVLPSIHVSSAPTTVHQE
jgi:hypothetical protein